MSNETKPTTNKWADEIYYEMDKSFIEACDRLVKHYGRLGLDNKGTDSDSHKQTSESE